MANWALKLLRRLVALPPGRYLISLTVGKQPDWTVLELGEVERVAQESGTLERTV